MMTVIFKTLPVDRITHMQAYR